MIDSKTATELLKELSALSCDINEEEIRAHSVISVKHGSYNRMYRLDMNREWLDAWHAEFDRIMQAIAATLGNERHPYQMCICGDGDTWEEIMKDALDDLVSAATESCTPDEMREFMAYLVKLGSRECENVSDDISFTCSACGSECYIDWAGSGCGTPRFCPNCGKAVKR